MLRGIYCCILILLYATFLVATSLASDRPNILFILSDDHTTQAISCYGGRLAPYAQTINIDRLASEGVRLENCFCSNSICSPSRATILTGQYSHRNGVFLLDQSLNSDSVTFPMILQRNGYQTGLFGKWHLKDRPVGFDDYRILPRQGRYQDPEFLSPGSDELTTYPGWSTDVIADMTMQYIRERDPAQPFLAMCQFKSTHDPWQSREPHRSLWKQESLPEPANLLDDYSSMGGASKRTTLKLEQINQGTYPHERLSDASDLEQRSFIYQQYIKDFLRCGRVLDENVGRLLKFLDQEGLARNTIVIYTTDQGHFLGEHGFFSKRFMYDESMRMPFIIRYPGKLEPGSVNEDMTTNADFAPTILELANVDTPKSMQGRSFLPNLQGKTPSDWPTAVYYHYWQHRLHRNVTAHYGIRTKTAKLIFFYGHSLGMTDFEPTSPEWEFYDLENDPQENHNAYKDPKYQQEISDLKKQLDRLKHNVNDLDEDFPPLARIRAEAEG